MALNLGLSVQDVVNVSVYLSPTAAQERSFSTLLILGDSGVIDTTSRYRLYTSATAVAADFGTTAPEYLAASIFFGQSPSPAQLYVGAWARTATSGTLIGGALSSAQQALSNFTSISNGSLQITIAGTLKTLSGINLTSVVSLNGVATAITTALSGAGNVYWNSVYNYFYIVGSTTGTTSTITFASTTGSGTDLSSLLSLQSSQGGYIAAGIAAETPVAAATILAAMSNSWYGLTFAASTMPTDTQLVAVAGFVQSAAPVRILGTTTQEAAALVTGDSTSLAYLMSNGQYTRTFVQYSSSSPYACCAIFGIAFTCQFNGVNTLYTLKFKQELGIAAETLTESQAAQLNTTNCNVFVNYNNSTAILQQGTMASGQFFDVIHGTDWLQNAVQTAVYNVLYTSTAKIPQTDQGVGLLVTAVTSELNQAVQNDLIAPGIWYGPAIGAIVTGQNLVKGYYVYAPPVATQSLAARAARQAPVITAAIKLAGAIHSASVVINVSN